MKLRNQAKIFLRRCHASHQSLQSLIVYPVSVFDVIRVAQIKCSKRGMITNKIKQLFLKLSAVYVVIS